jgi:hypothetical protein
VRAAIEVLVALAVLAGAWAWAARGQGWFADFLRDRYAIAGILMFAFCLAVMLAAWALIWRLGRQHRRQRKAAQDAQAGNAAVEFVLVLPFLLWIMLIMVQSMLMVAGNLSVHYASYIAARTAIVQVPSELNDLETRNLVMDPSLKRERIRQAAVNALVGVSAGQSGAGGSGGGDTANVETGLNDFFRQSDKPVPAWIANYYRAKYDYANLYTQATLYDPLVPPAYGDHEDLTVRVNHTFYLSVPYARAVFYWVPNFARPLDSGGYGIDMEATCTLTNQGVVDKIDVEVFPRTVGRG